MKLTAVLTLPGPNFNYEVSEQKLTIHSEVNGHSHFAFSLFHRNLLFSIKKGFATFLTTLVYWVTPTTPTSNLEFLHLCMVDFANFEDTVRW